MWHSRSCICGCMGNKMTLIFCISFLIFLLMNDIIIHFIISVTHWSHTFIYFFFDYYLIFYSRLNIRVRIVLRTLCLSLKAINWSGRSAGTVQAECQNTCGTIKTPPCLKDRSPIKDLNSAALHRELWHLYMKVMFWGWDVKEYITVNNQPTMYYTYDEVLYVGIGNSHKLLNSRTKLLKNV